MQSTEGKAALKMKNLLSGSVSFALHAYPHWPDQYVIDLYGYIINSVLHSYSNLLFSFLNDFMVLIVCVCNGEGLNA